MPSPTKVASAAEVEGPVASFHSKRSFEPRRPGALMPHGQTSVSRVTNHEARHPFRPLTTTLSRMKRWAKKKTPNSGTVVKTAAAMIVGQGWVVLLMLYSVAT